jgi:sulfate permease, SulP family
MLTGVQCRSNVDRCSEELQALKEQGHRIRIFKLHGFIFFGTAQKLLDRVKDWAQSRQGQEPGYVLLDFRQVESMDSSAVISFQRMTQLAKQHSLAITMAHLSPALLSLFAKSGMPLEKTPDIALSPDLDRGLEACEEELLAQIAHGACLAFTDIRGFLLHAMSDVDRADRLAGYLERMDLGPGQVLIRYGEEPDGMYFIESGRLRAEIAVAGNAALRLKAFGPWTTVGEIGLYDKHKRSATVTAERESVVWRFSLDALSQVQAREAELASAFHRLMAHILADRLKDTNGMLQVYMD